MEIKAPFTSSMILTIICVTTLLWCTLKTLNWVWWDPKMLEKKLREQGLKGNPYRILFGDLKDIGRMLKEAYSKPIEFNHEIVSRINPFIDRTLKNYGNNAFAWVGLKPMAILTDPNQIKEVFTKRSEKVSNVKMNPFRDYLVTGLASYEGTKAANTRKIVNPAFHLGKLKLMTPAFCESTRDVINKWSKILSTTGGASCELDVWPYMRELASDAISRTAFGSNFEQGRRIFDHLIVLTDLVTPLLSFPYVPGWRFLPTKTNLKIKALAKETQEMLKDMIEKREKAIRAGEATTEDLLNLLIQSNLRETEEHGSNMNSKSAGIMSIQDVIEECKLFHFAGHETVASLLVWTLILLAKHPDWQERAREEIMQAFGDKKPDFDGSNNLIIVTSILYEVLRIYPSLPWVARNVHKETKVGNLLLPKGIILLLATIHVHHAKELWGEDASEFNPSRFFDGASKATKDQLSFFPFGWGPRICIGMNFALLEAKMAIAMMLQKFTFDISPSYAHAPHVVVTIQPQYGAHLILRKL